MLTEKSIPVALPGFRVGVMEAAQDRGRAVDALASGDRDAAVRTVIGLCWLLGK